MIGKAVQQEIKKGMVDSNNVKRTADLTGLNAIVRQLRLWNRSQTSLSARETVTVIEFGLSLDDIPSPETEAAPTPASGAKGGNVRMFPAQVAVPVAQAPLPVPAKEPLLRRRGRPPKNGVRALPAPAETDELERFEVAAPAGSSGEEDADGVSAVSAAFPSYGTVLMNKLEGKDLAKIVDKTIFRDGIRCLECGRYYKVLKRHLAETHQMSEGDYRLKWRLPDQYPLVCPEHHRNRQDQRLKQIGKDPRNHNLLDAIEDPDGIHKAGKRRKPPARYVNDLPAGKPVTSARARRKKDPKSSDSPSTKTDDPETRD